MTPEWKVIDQGASAEYWFEHGAIEVGPKIVVGCGEFRDKKAADIARLIAAAPELLSALKAIWAAHAGRGQLGAALDQAEAAIAKATGGQS